MEESFYNYMMRFLKYDTPSGALARDMEHAHTRLREEVYNIKTREELISFLRFICAVPEVVVAAKSCWRKYMYEKSGDCEQMNSR